MKEKYNAFYQELRQIRDRRDTIEREYREKWTTYNKTLNELDVLLATGQTEGVEDLRKQVAEMREETANLKQQLDAMGPYGFERAKEIVRNTPSSTVHKKALELVDGYVEALQGHEERLKTLMEEEFPKVKDAYLDIMRQIGAAFREFYEAHGEAESVQECLPKEARKIGPIRTIAPASSFFLIDFSTIADAYGGKPIKRTK
jgi:hypothetical protein